jgi:uncharacterized membrane protein
MLARIANLTFSALLFLLGLFFVVLMVQLTLPYLSFRYDVDFLLTKQAILHVTAWRISFYTHIISSIFVLLTGILQFVRPLLRLYPHLHRLLGKVYVGCILLLSAPSGFVMALYASGGFWAKLSFSLVSVLWWCYTWQAYRLAVKGNIKQHRHYMYRSFALTLSAITLRSYMWVLPAFASLHHLHGKEMYVLVSWLSWVPNLLLAELLIRKPWARLLTSRPPQAAPMAESSRLA